MDSKDRILELLQHNGDWMILDTIWKESGIASRGAVMAYLKDFVGYQVVEERDEDGVKQYRAIMEPA